MLKKSYSSRWIVVVLIVLIIVLFLTIFLKRSRETDRRKAEFILLHEREKKLESELKEQKWLIKKLEKKLKRAYLITRIIVVLIGFGLIMLANFMWCTPTLEQYLAWTAFLTLFISVVTFLVRGLPADILSLLKQVEPLLKIKIYGEQLGLPDSIKKIEQELSEINEEKKKLEEEDESES